MFGENQEQANARRAQMELELNEDWNSIRKKERQRNIRRLRMRRILWTAYRIGIGILIVAIWLWIGWWAGKHLSS